MKTVIFESTRHLSDAEFEHEIHAVRALRRARAQAIAEERALHTATLGVSTRYANADAEPSRTALERAYIRNGMTPREAAAAVARLR